MIVATSLVTEILRAPPEEALAHFESLLRFETDCWEVHSGLANGDPAFVLLDVRSPALYESGHVPGAVRLPHARINQRNLAGQPEGTIFVAYCSGPHCNGADKAAVRLARLGRPVKKMIVGSRVGRTRVSS